MHTQQGVYYVLANERAVGPEAMKGAVEVARQRRVRDLVRKPHTGHFHPLTDPEVLGVMQCSYDPSRNALLRDQTYPTVNLSNSVGRLAEMGNLLSDDVAVGRMAARHLIQRGHRSFLVVWYEGQAPHDERARGFLQELEGAGLTAQTFAHSFRGSRELHKTHMRYLQGMREIVAAVLEKLPLGTGVFASNDELALLIQQVMQLFYPDHLETSGILGVDNDAPSFGYFGSLPELSSVQPAFHQMGTDAMAWLLDHPGAAGKECVGELHRCYPPVEVIARASTSAGACADPLTARMIRWMWERVRDGQLITVADLARSHHMARKTLERRFAEHAGGSPGELIYRLRLDLAREMLRSSSLRIAEISHRCGFAKQDVLSRALRAADGCTPREYRKKCGVRSAE